MILINTILYKQIPMPCNYAIENYSYASATMTPTTTYVSTTTMQSTTRVSDLVVEIVMLALIVFNITT